MVWPSSAWVAPAPAERIAVQGVGPTVASQIFSRQFKIPSSDRNLTYIPFDGIRVRFGLLIVSSGELREIPEGACRKYKGLWRAKHSGSTRIRTSFRRIFR
jgi:hypothetical protein